MESTVNQPKETQHETHPTALTKNLHDSQGQKNLDSDSNQISTIKWEGVFGLENAKKILEEGIMLPLKFPHLFTNSLKHGAIFLFGPPGVGKTHFVKATAKEFGMNLLCYEPGDFISKYIGDPEKVLQEAFKEAQEKQPAIIFFDDIDYLFSQRQDHGSEAIRRVRDEFLIQCAHLPKEAIVFILGAGNCPWDLDLAVRKRFALRIYLKLPDSNTRELLLKDQFSKVSHKFNPEDFTSMANQTEGFSDADLVTLARDLIMEPLREITKVTHFRPVETLPDGNPVYEPCLETDAGAGKIDFLSLKENQLKIRPVEMEDFTISITRVRRSVGQELVDRYGAYANDFGVE